MQEVNEKYLEKIKRMRFMDDDFMCAAFKDDPIAVREVLVPIMGRDDLTVQSVTVQDTYTNLRGHSVRLDVVATDSTGKLYDIEIQRSDHGAAEKRARYNLGMLDSHNLAAGGDYSLLPETWIILSQSTTSSAKAWKSITSSELFGKPAICSTTPSISYM